MENWILTEKDFYPPSDNRELKSLIEDIEGGDNYSDYCKYIFQEDIDDRDDFDNYYKQFFQILNKIDFLKD